MSHAVRLRAPAKVNLRLVILAREASGYHQLETVFCRLRFGDLVDIRVPRTGRAGGDEDVETAAGHSRARARDADPVGVDAARAGGSGVPASLQLEVRGPDLGPVSENLAFRAASVFFGRAGLPPAAAITLIKRIPAGSGLGGGSSDAAATLLGLNRLHGEPLAAAQLLEIGAELGSDVPFFLSGVPLALAWGRGERILPLAPLTTVPVLLACPPFPSPTADAYAGLAAMREAGRAAPEPEVIPSFRSWEALVAAARNDLEPVLFRRFHVLREIRDALAAAGARLALLAGSGSALFAIFGSAADRAAAAARVRSAFPDVRLVQTWTAGSRHASP